MIFMFYSIINCIFQFPLPLYSGVYELVIDKSKYRTSLHSKKIHNESWRSANMKVIRNALHSTT